MCLWCGLVIQYLQNFHLMSLITARSLSSNKISLVAMSHPPPARECAVAPADKPAAAAARDAVRTWLWVEL